MRHPDLSTSAEDSDLTALLDAVTGGPVAGRRTGAALVDADRLRRLGVSDPGPMLADSADEVPIGRPHLRVVPDATDAIGRDAGGPEGEAAHPGPGAG